MTSREPGGRNAAVPQRTASKGSVSYTALGGSSVVGVGPGAMPSPTAGDYQTTPVVERVQGADCSVEPGRSDTPPPDRRPGSNGAPPSGGGGPVLGGQDPRHAPDRNAILRQLSEAQDQVREANLLIANDAAEAELIFRAVIGATGPNEWN